MVVRHRYTIFIVIVDYLYIASGHFNFNTNGGYFPWEKKLIPSNIKFGVFAPPVSYEGSRLCTYEIWNPMRLGASMSYMVYGNVSRKDANVSIRIEHNPRNLKLQFFQENVANLKGSLQRFPVPTQHTHTHTHTHTRQKHFFLDRK